MKCKEVSIERFGKERTIYYFKSSVLLLVFGVAVFLFLGTRYLTVERKYQGIFQEDGFFHLLVPKSEVTKWQKKTKVKVDGIWVNCTVRDVLSHREDKTTRELLLEFKRKESIQKESSMILEKEKSSVLKVIVDTLGGNYA